MVLFFAASIALMGMSFIAFWILYYNYIPKVSLEREVHLQFGYVFPLIRVRNAIGVKKELVANEGISHSSQ